MKHFNPQPEISAKLLATDLDGTLIPLPQNVENIKALSAIFDRHENGQLKLIYATGRHFESVLEAIDHYSLPEPEWIVCDVGTAIYQHNGSEYRRFSLYEDHLSEHTGPVNRTDVEKLLQGIEGLELQAPDYQQRFKVSYHCHSETLSKIIETVEARLAEMSLPYDAMGSLDPFMNRGLIDVLPKNVSKAYALLWLSTHADFSPHEVVYAGDSGNDYAALTSGFRAIIVANASDGLIEKVTRHLDSSGSIDRLYVAQSQATTGVFEGCQHFKLL